MNMYPYIISRQPLKEIFNHLKEQWVIKDKGNLTAYYEKNEAATRDFERQFIKDFPEIYDELYKHCSKSEGKIAGSIKPADPQNPILFFDAMSIREISIFEQFILPKITVKTKITAYKTSNGYSAIPSTTGAFTKRHFDSTAPSRIRDDAFEQLIYKDSQETKIPQGKSYYWSTLPDALFHKTDRQLSMESMVGIWIEESVKIIQRILEGDIETLTITSDHGYLYKPKAYSWNISDKAVERQIKEIFKNTRNQPVSEGVSLPKNIVKVDEENMLLVGRAHPGGTDSSSHMVHGGLSFLECITPGIIITK